MKTNFKIGLPRQPFDLFLLTTILLFIFPFFTWRNSIDFHLHDTYFVVSAVYPVWLLALGFLLIWTIYKLTNRILWTRYLTWFHIISTLVVLILILSAGLWYESRVPTSRKEIIAYETRQEQQHKQLLIFLPIVTTFLLGQAAFVINLIGGLIKRATNKT
ncbi:hypothetical protein QTN47_24380 [Danxiaibacter flavus]|uniref:Uncharacterized protein n=1 Tax=Danxiaibacter flavus TaxID=3049108 RepID=A0ABV3ZLA5_9BACT|nr:hypothetical protein QNM32_24385 [Chitinophagaceae bacterium DXS]